MDSDDDLEFAVEELMKSGSALHPRNRSTSFLISLAIGIGGLQSIFALIFSNGSIYLTGLGLSKPHLALVWLAGPLCGMILQPYFGYWSDRCHSSWGKRRPFIAVGALVTIGSLLGLASAEKLPNDFFHALDLKNQRINTQHVSAGLAVAEMFVLNAAIQPLQGGLRALIVDMVPKHQQLSANAWAGIFTSITNLLCYSLSAIDLNSWTIGSGYSQFSSLCLATALLLGITVAITCSAVDDGPSELTLKGLQMSGNSIHPFFRLCNGFTTLSPRIKNVFKAQFFSWMGWFPFLYYITMYIGGLFSSAEHHAQISSFKASFNNKGYLGMIIFSLVALFAGTAIPLLVAYCEPVSARFNQPDAWYQNPGRVWMGSQILFAICMFATILVSSLWQVYVLVGLSGISWGITIWAPHAIISSDIARWVGHEDSPSPDGDNSSEGGPGIIVGLHNAAIAGPQIVAALGCSIVFWALDGVSNDSIGWCLRAGGLAAAVGAWLTRNL